MTTPTLALGISAAGAKQVADLAQSVAQLKTNLAELAKVSGGQTINNLDRLTQEFREMRQEMVQTMQGIRTDLAAGFEKAFASAAAQTRAGTEKVEAEAKRGAARVRLAFKGFDMGDDLKASISAQGINAEKAVRELASKVAQMPAVVRAAQEATLREQVAFEGQQKARWATYLADLQVRMNAERNMMAEAVAQFRAIQQTQLTDQLLFEEKQKAAWLKYQADLEARMAKERFMMADAVAQFRAIKDAELAAQLAAEEKQKALWIKHEAELAKRLATEKSMMDAAVANYKKNQMERLAATARGQIGVAMNNPGSGGIWGQYMTFGGGAQGTLKDIPDQAEKAGGAMRKFTKELNDAHSAARGLASGFGAMWLTWGNIVPLLAGAALSHSFVQTIKMGAQVQHEMETIRVLSEETRESMAGLNTQLLELARSGPFGPQEIAKAMRTLSLAGLDAKEVAASIKTVLDFAVAGTTSIEQSADVLTTVGTAFKISAQDYSYIGDVIAKTAAVSKSSVESIGSAFKTASVINSQYGASLKDVGTGLAILSNVGIQGTAAGTALRNMYVDLMGRTPKVAEALKKLGVDAFDPATGKARAFVDIIKDLNTGLSKLKPADQTKALMTVFSERGGKAGVEAIQLLREKAKQAGVEVNTMLDEMRKKIEDSAGFMTVSAAQMALTPLNQLKSVSATLQATLVESFNNIQPQVLGMAQTLREAFASEEFKTAIQNLTSLVANFTAILVNNANTILLVGSALLGLKIVSSISSLWAMFSAQVVGATASLVAVAGAMRNASFASVALQGAAAGAGTAQAAAGVAAAGLAGKVGLVLGVVGRLLPILSAVVVGWQLYSIWSDRAGDKSSKYVDNSGALIGALRSEADRLREINEAKALGISLDEMKARKTAQAAKAELDAGVAAANADVEKKQQALRNYKPSNISWLDSIMRGRLENQLAEAQQKRSNALQYQHDRGLQVQAAEADAREQAQIRAKQLEEELRASQVQIPQGLGTWDGGGTNNKGRKVPVSPYSREMSDLHSMLQTRESALKDAYDREMQLLDLKHRNQLVSEGEYQALTMQRSAKFEEQNRAIITDEMAKMKRAYEDRRSQLLADKAKGADVSQALKNLDSQYERFVESANNTLQKLNNDSFQRQQTAVITLQGEIKKLTLTNEDYWQKADIASQKDAEAARIRQQTIGMSEEQRASMEAANKVEAQHAKYLQDLQDEYLLTATAISDFNTALQLTGDTSAEAQKRYSLLQEKLKTLAGMIETGRSKVDSLKQQAADAAFQEAQAKQLDEMAKNISSSLADAILNGGKDGGERLKDWLKNYFLKEPLKVVLQAFLQPVGQWGAGLLQSFMGGGGGGLGGLFGGGGGMNNLFSAGAGLLGSAGAYASVVPGLSAVGAGSQAAMLASQTGVFGAAGLGATASAGGAGMLGTAISGIGAAMPYIGAALMVASLFSGKRGGPKTESGYGYGVATRGNPAASQAFVNDIQSQYDALITTLGGKAGGLEVGAFSAMDPQGTAQTQLDVRGRLNGQEFYNRVGRTGGWENVARGEDALKAALAEETGRLLLGAIQASGLTDSITAYVKSLGDLNQMAADDINKTLARVQKAAQERASLNDRLLGLAPEEEKLAKARERERAAVDELNRSLLEQVYAEEDLAKAKETLVDAYNREKTSMEDSIKSHRDFAQQLRDFVKNSFTGSTSSLDIFGRAREAASGYNSALAGAQGGDATARGNLTGAASTYLETVAASASTKLEYDRAFGKVMGDLSTLAASEDSKATIEEQQLAVMTAQLTSLNLLNNTQATFAQAWLAYQDAQAKADQAKAAAAVTAAATASSNPVTPAAAPTYSDTDPATGLPWGPGTRYPTKVEYVRAHPVGMGGGGQPQAYADGGYHSGGLRWVGEDGPELEFTGPSMIMDSKRSLALVRAVTSGAGAATSSAADAALLQEIRMLRYEVQAVALHTAQTKSLTKEFRDRGMPVTNLTGDTLNTKAV